MKEDFLYTMGSEYNYRVKGHLFHEDNYYYYLLQKREYYKDSTFTGIYNDTCEKIAAIESNKEKFDAITALMHDFFEKYLGFGTTKEAVEKRQAIMESDPSAFENNRDIAKMLMHTRLYREQMVNLFVAAKADIPEETEGKLEALCKLVRDNLFALSVQERDHFWSDAVQVMPKNKICLMLSSDDAKNVVLPVSYEDSAKLDFDKISEEEKVKATKKLAGSFEVKLSRIVSKFEKETGKDFYEVNKENLTISDMACDPRRYGREVEIIKGKEIAEREEKVR